MILSGCAGGGATTGSGVTVTFLTHWGGEQLSALQTAASNFHGKNPTITVKVEAVPFANLLTTLRTRGGSADGPTMAGIYDLWLPELIRDGVASAAPDQAAADIKANYSKGAFEGVSRKGATYGYPTEMAVYALNYNKRLFEKAGIVSPPTTWAEFRDDAKKLTDPAKGQQGAGVITVWNNGTIHPFLSFAASNGASLVKAGSTTEPALTSANMIETAKLYENLVKDGSTKAQMSASNADTAGDYLQNFATGKTAMLVMANPIQGNLLPTMGKDLFNKEIGVAAIPVGPSGTKSTGISYSWINIVNGKASSEKRDAAWKFLQYLNGSESGKNGSSAQGDILMGIGILPSRLSDIAAHQGAIDADPFRAEYAKLMVDATPFPTLLGGEAASKALSEQIEAIIFGTKSAEKAMQDAQAGVKTALEQGQ